MARRCTYPACPHPVERRLKWLTLIVSGWTLTTERELCRFHAHWVETRLKKDGVALEQERFPYTADKED